MTEQSDIVDFALAAFLDDGEWEVQEILPTAFESVAELADALHRLPHDSGVVGMVSVDEDFFVVVRVAGDSTRVLLSDISAAERSELAQSALDFLRLPAPDDDAVLPAGDLDLLHDLGFHTMDMAELLEDTERYPDDVLADIADALGFGDEFDDAVEMTAG